MPASRHGERLPMDGEQVGRVDPAPLPPHDTSRRHRRQLPAARRLGAQSGAIWPDLGPRWVRIRTVAQGRGPSRTGASGREKPQVIASPAQAAGMIRQAQIVVPKVGGSGLSTRCREPSGSWSRGGGHRGRASPFWPSWSRRHIDASSFLPAVPPACHKQRSPAVSSGQSGLLEGDRWLGAGCLTWGGGGGRNCMACTRSRLEFPPLRFRPSHR
jgi:hypothetical protein